MTSKITSLLTVILLFLSCICRSQTIYKVNTDANLRSGPGTKYRSIDIIKNGANVSLVEQTNSTWVKINYNGKVGFISSKLVTSIPTRSPAPPTPVSVTTSTDDQDRMPYFILFVIAVVLILIAKQRKKGTAIPLSNSIPSKSNQSSATSKTDSNNRLKKPLPASEKILVPQVQTNTTVKSANISQPEKKIFLVDSILQNAKVEVLTNTEAGISPSNPIQTAVDNMGNNSSTVQDGVASEYSNSIASKDIIAGEPGKNEIPEIITPVNSETGNEKNDTMKTTEDESIIDVSGSNYNLSVPEHKISEKITVPPWDHQYVYSAGEINYATNEQKIFYTHFKQRFLDGIYLDLNGNTNYCFILLFDVIDDYRKHRSLALVENQIEKISKYYPETSRYGMRALLIKLEAIGDQDALRRIRLRYNISIQSIPPTPGYHYGFDQDYWRLGTKFQSSLSLTGNEVSILNRIWSPTNNFFSIEHCGNMIIKLFVSVIRFLDQKFSTEQSSLEKEITTVVDFVLRKHFHYRQDSYNYLSSIDSVKVEIYTTIFKLCENAVREHFGHKRKLNTDSFITTPEAKAVLDSRIMSQVHAAITQLISSIQAPDETTELELNSQNTARWKPKFDELSTKFNGKPKEFMASVLSLAKQNSRNPAVENLFFEASKFLAKIDKESSLLMYVHYIYHDLNSSSFDNRKLSKTVQKSLFNSNDQLHSFEKLLSDLISDRNLQNALDAVPKIYSKKRKTIQLDTEYIKEVQEQHSDTVELLNVYLKDEYEDEINIIKTEQTSLSEIQIDISSKNAIAYSSIYVNDINFTEEQFELLQIFSKNNFSILQTDAEAFAKSKAFFKNQLIERINEICFDCLDDVLIEEEDETLTINPEYYKSILKS